MVEQSPFLGVERNPIERAKNLATQKHADQEYGDHPYSYHLNYVSNILIEFGYANDESMIVAAWLHDIVEDTDTTCEMLVTEFGQEVADLVWAVTNEPGQNRAERLQKTAQKIKANPKALALKLADRITNTEFNLNNNPRLYQMYVKEFALFRTLLYDPRDVALQPMWERLSQLSSHSLTN